MPSLRDLGGLCVVGRPRCRPTDSEGKLPHGGREGTGTGRGTCARHRFKVNLGFHTAWQHQVSFSLAESSVAVSAAVEPMKRSRNSDWRFLQQDVKKAAHVCVSKLLLRFHGFRSELEKMRASCC